MNGSLFQAQMDTPGKDITPDDSLRHMASSEKGILHRDAFSYANFQERKPQAQRDWQDLLQGRAHNAHIVDVCAYRLLYRKIFLVSSPISSVASSAQVSQKVYELRLIGRELLKTLLQMMLRHADRSRGVFQAQKVRGDE